MNRYGVAGADGRSAVLATNDRPMSVPASLHRYVLAVTGLNSTVPKAMHLTPGPNATASTPARSARRTGVSTPRP